MKWIVKIPATHFMAGIHRFKTKKDAQRFVYEWNRLPENTKGLSYHELPRPIKEIKRVLEAEL